MAVTAEIVLSGSWELLYTNSSAVNVPIVMTPRGDGVRWAVREDTTLPANGFEGHNMNVNEDFQRFVEPGESFFINGQQGRSFYHSTGD